MTSVPCPTADQLQALSRCLLDLYHLDLGEDRSGFIDRVFARYASLIPHDAGLWGGGRMVGNPPVVVLHFAHLHGIAAAEIVPVWEKQTNVAPRRELATRMSASMGCAQIVDGATPGLEQAFELLFGFCGIRQLLTVYLSDPDARLSNTISLYRKNESPFTEAERFLHQLAAPHLAAVLRDHSLKHLGIPGSFAGGHAGAAAAVDLAGTLHFAHPEFVRRLREEWPGWTGPDLPAAIAPSGVEPLRFSYVGKQIVVRAEAGADLYRYHARRKGRIDDLTAREREVAESFACGHNYKEVARDLGIAPNTVRNVLVSIYGKLGISDKGKLAQFLAGQQGER